MFALGRDGVEFPQQFVSGTRLINDLELFAVKYNRLFHQE